MSGIIFHATQVFFIGITFAILGRAIGQSCQEYDRNPTTFLLSNESSCHIRTGPDAGCWDCSPYGWNCCDDGSSMQYDKFCRYPSECCAEKYCGQQCCNSGHGVPCGPLCAPKGYSCCNSQTGQLCKSPDTCCGDHCCPGNYECCGADNVCCEKGTTCCPGAKGGSKCCPAGTECCGDHCCLKGMGDVCKAGVECCPGARLCNDNICCPAGLFCPRDANTCCDNQWCDETKRCCHNGYHCNDVGGCCQNGLKFCPDGSIDNCFATNDVCCSDGGACPEHYPNCMGDYCCPDGYPKLCESQGLCHGDNGGNCECCGGSECCYGEYSCQGGVCKHCYKKGSWWWKHTVCDTQSNSATHADPISRKHAPYIGKLKPNMGQPNQVDHFLSKIRPQRHVKSAPVALNPKKVTTNKNGIQTNVMLPPAPTHIRNPSAFSCFKQAQISSDPCVVFPCLTEMVDCGQTGYLKEADSLYCAGVNQYRDLFNSGGQSFLDCLTENVTLEHVNIFKQGIIPCCLSLESWGQGSMQENAFKKCGFCKPELFFMNAGAFDTLFNNDGDTNIYQVYYKVCDIAEPEQQKYEQQRLSMK